MTSLVDTPVPGDSRAGDPAARAWLAEVAALLWSTHLRLPAGLSRHEADDLIQDLFLDLATGLPPPPANLAAYLQRALQFKFRTRLRRRRAERWCQLEECAALGYVEDPSDTLEPEPEVEADALLSGFRCFIVSVGGAATDLPSVLEGLLAKKSEGDLLAELGTSRSTLTRRRRAIRDYCKAYCERSPAGRVRTRNPKFA